MRTCKINGDMRSLFTQSQLDEQNEKNENFKSLNNDALLSVARFQKGDYRMLFTCLPKPTEKRTLRDHTGEPSEQSTLSLNCFGTNSIVSTGRSSVALSRKSQEYFPSNSQNLCKTSRCMPWRKLLLTSTLNGVRRASLDQCASFAQLHPLSAQTVTSRKRL